MQKYDNEKGRIGCYITRIVIYRLRELLTSPLRATVKYFCIFFRKNIPYIVIISRYTKGKKRRWFNVQREHRSLKDSPVTAHGGVGGISYSVIHHTVVLSANTGT